MAWLVAVPAAVAFFSAASVSAERTRRALEGLKPPPYKIRGPYLVSVVVPAYNEEAVLPRFLSSIKNQTYEPIEVIVAVDRRTTDRTREIAQEFGATVVEVAEPGVGAARDAGSAIAGGDIIIHGDADAVWGHQVVEEVVRELERGADLVHVPATYIDVGPLRPITDVATAVYSHRVSHWRTDGHCLGVWRTVQESLGGFLGLPTSETWALGLRAAKRGYKVANRPDLPVAVSGRHIFGLGRAARPSMELAERFA